MELVLRAEHLEVRHLTTYAEDVGEVLKLGEGRAVYAGPGLPVNVAAGVGAGADGVAWLPEAERFLLERGVTPAVVAYSHIHADALKALSERDFFLTRLLHVHARALSVPVPAPALSVREVAPVEWLPIAVAAFGQESRPIMRRTAARPHAHFWVCDMAGEAVAAGALSVFDLNSFGRAALLFSAATHPERRGRGAQTALLGARLRQAQDLGAEVAYLMVTPGTPSERNARRAGFEQVAARLSFTKRR